MKKTMKFQFLFLLVVTLLSCGSDDDSTNDQASFIRAQIDGVQWEATQTNNSTILRVGEEGQRYDVSAQNEAYRIELSITQNTVGDCMEFTDFVEDNVLVVLSRGLPTGNYAGEHTDDPSGPEEGDFVVTITSCNNGSISGTFSGTQYAINSDTDPQTISITNGVFNNVPFDLIEL